MKERVNSKEMRSITYRITSIPSASPASPLPAGYSPSAPVYHPSGANPYQFASQYLTISYNISRIYKHTPS